MVFLFENKRIDKNIAKISIHLHQNDLFYSYTIDSMTAELLGHNCCSVT